MIIQGQFRNINNELITVKFTKNDGDSTTINIGDNIKFSGNPVTIETTNDDLFNTIIRKSAKVNLLTDSYIGNLFFASNSRDVLCEIKKGSNEWMFYGYVDPCTFNQPYTSPLDDFEINCIDVLSTLQFYNYKNAKVGNYQEIKNAAKNVTFQELLNTIFNGLDVTVYYDKSKGISSNRLNNIFDDLTISELNITGEEYDDIWTCEQLLDEILKYLNLHIVQEGKNCFIYDWDSIKNQNTSWVNLSTGTTITVAAPSVNVTSVNHADNSTNVSIDDVYNQISIKCDLNEQETIIQSPLDKDSLTSLYKGKQLYMTEYISEGSGNHSNSAFNNIVRGQSDSYDKCKTVDWFLQFMTNKNWKMYYNSTNTVDELAEKSGNEYVNQWKLPKYLKSNSCVPSIFRMGNVEHQGGPTTDNSPISKVDMNDYLYISVNGNEDDTENGHQPSDSMLENHAPICEYIGNNSGGVFSPIDDDTINYLVFSGKMLLQPVQWESGRYLVTKNNNYETIRINGADRTEGADAQVPAYSNIPILTSNLIKSENNTEGRYYTRKFYTQQKVTDKPLTYLTDGSAGIQPWTQDKSAHGYQYHYSASGEGSDLYAKLPILECELIIGNKRLVEENIDEYGNSTFKWYELGQEPTETIDGVTYTITTFSLGINPKIDDYIIGEEFDIQNTIDYTMNVDAEGTAIPIKKSDNISGQVYFKILGTINTLWNQISRRHPTFWRHTQWSSNSRFLLAHTENVIIKDFECKIYTNNGMNESFDNNEIIYTSNENDNFIDTKDDITFNFVTQLSSQECLNMGVKQSVNLNSVIDSTTGSPLLNLYNSNTQETDKAEKHYINQYYLNYSSPKILLETNLHNSNITKWNSIYHSTGLNKDFHVLKSDNNLKFNEITLTLREI